MKKRDGRKSAETGPVVDEQAAVERVMALMPVRGTSGHEREVAEWIRQRLLEAGARPEQISMDQVNRRSPLLDGGGDCGNLVFRLRGTVRAPRRMLCAHMDTVPLCVGSKPVRRGDRVTPAGPATALGADDRTGCAVTLTAAVEILRRGLPHPPLTFLWTVQEEVGMYGVRMASLGAMGSPKMVFNWDGGHPGTLVTGATGSCSMEAVIHGLASHAGGEPERGVSAAAIFGLAMSDLVRNGWHGLVLKDGLRGTSNIGVVRGGDATNVVMDRLEVQAEARAQDRGLRRRIVEAFQAAFEAAAKRVRNKAGVCGRVTWNVQDKYDAFVLAAGEPCVLEAERAVRTSGTEPDRRISNAGLDANWLNARGLPTVTLGTGMSGAHTVSESLSIDQYLAACRVALCLATEDGRTCSAGAGRKR
ncbi:MAG: M20/M25/M40 family metallo-hydrolase [Lentisphaerae bacterium]|nr:M20/M25/M40 family metallo-hydrolase [Lentisphaerota bacterium]